MPVYNKRGILLLPKVIVLNPKDGFVCHFPKCYAQAFRPMAYSWNHPHNYSDRLRIFYMLVFARIGPMDILNGHFNVKSVCIF